MLSVSEAEGRAAALVEAARQGRRRRRRRPLYRRCLDRGAGPARRAGGRRPAPKARRSACASSSASARRASPRPTCRPTRSPLWSSAPRRWRARRPRIPMPASRPRTGCCAATAPDLEADDGADPSPVALKERALAIEEAARAVPGITNSAKAPGSAPAGRWSRSRPATASRAAIRPAAMAARRA